MTDINNFAQLYSELSLNPDLPTLAERCKLLLGNAPPRVNGSAV